jgi:hypothetical protein
MRGKTSVAALPTRTASTFEGCGISMTRALGSAARATSAVRSVHPLHTTTTSRSAPVPSRNARRLRPMVAASLWAGMTTLATAI